MVENRWWSIFLYCFETPSNKNLHQKSFSALPPFPQWRTLSLSNNNSSTKTRVPKHIDTQSLLEEKRLVLGWETIQSDWEKCDLDRCKRIRERELANLFTPICTCYIRDQSNERQWRTLFVCSPIPSNLIIFWDATKVKFYHEREEESQSRGRRCEPSELLKQGRKPKVWGNSVFSC